MAGAMKIPTTTKVLWLFLMLLLAAENASAPTPE